MPAFSVALPLVLAVVLIASGVAKLVHPDDLAGWTEFGVPKPFRRTWLLRLHPWGELVLGVLLAVLGGALGLVAALIAVVLMAAYTVVVVRLWRRPGDAACACFGAPKRVTGVTVARNVWLLLVAAGAASVIWATPLWGGATAAGAASAGWIFALVVAAVTTGLILWPEDRPATVTAAAAALTVPTPTESAGESTGEELDYVRLRIPALPVSFADGREVVLRDLAAYRPILLLAVSEHCGDCAPVVARVGEWRTRLPEVDIRLLLMTDPSATRYTEYSEPQSLHDPHAYVSRSLGDWATPTAVLLGTDGLLAGGPVSGQSAVAAFIDDVYAALHPDAIATDAAADAAAADAPGD